MRLAIGVGRRRAALVAGGQAAVDAVAVAIIGDDEHAPLRLRGTDETEAQNDDESGQACTHDNARYVARRQPGANDENASKIVKGRLTLVAPLFVGLDGVGTTHHCAAVMNGLNHICGICREIIS